MGACLKALPEYEALYREFLYGFMQYDRLLTALCDCTVLTFPTAFAASFLVTSKMET
jgi:hypothetical protein